MSVFETFESNVRSYCRTFTANFHTAKGSYITDEDGRRYLDFFCAAGSLNYGHNHPKIKQRLIEYIENDGLTTSLDFHSSAKCSFIESIAKHILAPRNLSYKIQFTGPTGTNAVEAALKLARKVSQRSNVVCFTNAYHGHSLGALAVTGNSYYRNASGVPLCHSTFLPYDGYLGKDVSSLEYFEKLLEDTSSGLDLPAAVIVETIQAEGGVNIASSEWLKNLAALCSRSKIILIIDDIQVGCGRSGNFFSFEAAGIYPDIVILSKSISGMGLPLSILLIKPELDVWKPGEHNGTFRGNNLAFVTGRAAIDLFWTDETFIDHLNKCSIQISGWINTLQAKMPTLIIRGRGMIWAIGSTGTQDFAKHVSSRCFQNGLIVETCGGRRSLLKLLPPLTVTSAELDEGLEIILSSIASLVNQ